MHADRAVPVQTVVGRESVCSTAVGVFLLGVAFYSYFCYLFFLPTLVLATLLKKRENRLLQLIRCLGFFALGCSFYFIGFSKLWIDQAFLSHTGLILLLIACAFYAYLFTLIRTMNKANKRAIVAVLVIGLTLLVVWAFVCFPYIRQSTDGLDIAKGAQEGLFQRFEHIWEFVSDLFSGRAGEILLYLWKCRGKRHGRFGYATVRLLVLEFFALAAVWLRTYWSTGLPATSVWTSLFLKLGFQFRYPYSATDIGSVNFVPWSVAFSRIPFFINRVYQFFFGPIDMDHLVIAWGSCLVTFLAQINLWSLIRWGRARSAGRLEGSRDGATTTNMGKRFLLILWVINLLAALGILFIGNGVDANYFMLFYICTLLSGVVMIDQRRTVSRVCIWMMIAFNLVVMGTTNWAWTTGFSERSWVNPG